MKKFSRSFAVASVAAIALLSLPAAGQQWRISQAKAEKMILDEYPKILKNAFLWGPREVPLSGEITGFADKGTIVWWIKVHCDNGGMHASFLIHADTGELFILMRPGDLYSERCVN